MIFLRIRVSGKVLPTRNGDCSLRVIFFSELIYDLIPIFYSDSLTTKCFISNMFCIMLDDLSVLFI